MPYGAVDEQVVAEVSVASKHPELASWAVHRAYQMLRLGFTVVPIVAGVDKFVHRLVDWDQYLAPSLARMLPVDGHTFMLAVGVIEIIAGLLVAVRPHLGGYLVAGWLWGIVVNLLLVPGFYDIALRDVGLSLGALALATLSQGWERKTLGGTSRVV